MKTVKIGKMNYLVEPGVGAPDDAVNIEELTTSELVSIHNLASQNMGGGRVNRFSDKATALKRTRAKLLEFIEFLENGDEAEPEKAKKTPSPKKGGRKKRGMRFVFPKTDEVKKTREGTNRAKLIELLSREKGASFEECMAATWGPRKDMSEEQKVTTTYEGIRLLHYYVGYGMRQDEAGRIYLVK